MRRDTICGSGLRREAGPSLGGVSSYLTKFRRLSRNAAECRKSQENLEIYWQELDLSEAKIRQLSKSPSSLRFRPSLGAARSKASGTAATGWLRFSGHRKLSALLRRHLIPDCVKIKDWIELFIRNEKNIVIRFGN